MYGLWNRCLRKLAKKWLEHKGIRFYETRGLPTNAESIRTTFQGSRVNDGEVEVTFEFYREVFRDQVFRRGIFYTEEYHVFLVRAAFKGHVEEHFLKFNDTRLMCKNGLFPLIPDDVVTEVLQGLYIAYIKAKLQ